MNDKTLEKAFDSPLLAFAAQALDRYEKLIMGDPDTPRQVAVMELDENGSPVQVHRDIPISLAGAIQSLKISPVLVHQGLMADQGLAMRRVILDQMRVGLAEGLITTHALKGDAKAAIEIVRLSRQPAHGGGVHVNVQTIGSSQIDVNNNRILQNEAANAAGIDPKMIDRATKHLLTSDEDEDAIDAEIVDDSEEEDSDD